MKVTRNVLSQSGQKAKTRDPLVTCKLQEQDMAPHLLTWHRTLTKEVSALIALSSLTADSWQIWKVFTSFQEIMITTLIQMRRTDVKNWLTGKDPDAGKDWWQEEKGTTEGWDGWMASLTLWTWVWVNSGNWWWTGKPGMLQSMGSQRVRHDWETELNFDLDGLWFGTFLMMQLLCSYKFDATWQKKIFFHKHQILVKCVKFYFLSIKSTSSNKCSPNISL